MYQKTMPWYWQRRRSQKILPENPAVPKQLSHLPQQNDPPFIKAAPLLTDISKLPDENHLEVTVTKKPCTAFGGGKLPEELTEICNTHGHGGGVGGLAKIKEKREKECNVSDDVREIYQKFPARLKKRPSGEMMKDKTLGKYPGRASESSLDRSRPGSTSSSGNGRKKDTGEISGRRSRSPVSRTNVGSSKIDLGRSPSSRRFGKSHGRVGSGLGDRLRKMDEGKENCGDRWQLTSNEMLKNPAVSFIFL